MLSRTTTALLWDVDGTLIDTTAMIVSALRHVYRDFLGKEVPAQELRALIGLPLEEQMQLLGDPLAHGTSVEEMEIAAIRYYERQRSHEHPIPEAIDALVEAKRRGVKTALVTSKNDIELAHILPRLGISAYCDVIVGADQAAPYFKPHPRSVELALQQLGVAAPAQAVYIGDSVYDMRSGRAAGVRIAAVLWGAGSAELLCAEEPEFIFEHPADLLAFVREQIPIRSTA